MHYVCFNYFTSHSRCNVEKRRGEKDGDILQRNFFSPLSISAMDFRGGLVSNLTTKRECRTYRFHVFFGTMCRMWHISSKGLWFFLKATMTLPCDFCHDWLTWFKTTVVLLQMLKFSSISTIFPVIITAEQLRQITASILSVPCNWVNGSKKLSLQACKLNYAVVNTFVTHYIILHTWFEGNKKQNKSSQAIFNAVLNPHQRPTVPLSSTPHH